MRRTLTDLPTPALCAMREQLQAIYLAAWDRAHLSAYRRGPQPNLYQRATRVHRFSLLVDRILDLRDESGRPWGDGPHLISPTEYASQRRRD